jgi:dynein heavy chain, axonemal
MISMLEKEINIDFQRSMNKITFDSIVSNNRDTFAFVTLPPKSDDIVPELGCIAEVPAYDFDTQYYNFSFNSLLTRKESIDALCRVRVECNKAAAMSLFQIPNKHMRLDEFEQSQTQQTSQTSLFLKDSWINTLKSGIRSCFLDFGKGWFNIKETDYSVYQISKLKKFMELVKFSMQDSLRYLVQDSLVNYTQMVVDSCWQVIDIKDTFEWPESDLINSSLKPKRNAIFLIELQIDKNGPRYNANFESFENILCGLFEKAIASTQSVPQLEKVRNIRKIVK